MLPATAFRAATVEQQLDEAARAFINDPAKVRLSEDGRTMWLSRIFDWFGEDFGGQEGAVRFCQKYLPEATAEAIRHQPPKVRWLEYDWSLNERQP